MKDQVKESIQRDPEGHLQEEKSEGVTPQNPIPERHQIKPEVVQRIEAEPNVVKTVGMLIEQEKSITGEWRHDLAEGTRQPRDLELYFAGKVDQHNTLVALASHAFPEVRETLPRQIDFAELKSNLQQEYSRHQAIARAFVELPVGTVIAPDKHSQKHINAAINAEFRKDEPQQQNALGFSV